MDRETLDKWCERGILWVVIACLVYGPLAFGGVRAGDFAYLQGAVALAIVFWGLRLWLSPSYRLQWLPACWFVLGFMAWAGVRYLQADVEYVARLECLRILVYGWLFFLVLNNLHRQESTLTLLSAALVIGTAISLYAGYQFLTESNTVWGVVRPKAYHGRGSGTFICPNHLAGYLEMLLPVALAIVILSRRRAVARIFTAYAALMIFAGIGVSVSRGGYLATGLSLLFLLGVLFWNRAFRRYAVIGLVVLATLTAVFLQKARHPRDRFRLMFVDGQQENVTVRADLWRPTVKMWLDHPWVGVGPAHFDLRFPAYRPVTVQTRPIWSHNDYLNALADWGVVGGVLIGGALFSVAWGGWRTWRFVRRSADGIATKLSDRAAFVLGTGVGLLALAMHSFVDFNMQIPSNAMLAVTLMAILSSHLRFTSNRYWLNPQWYGRVVITVLGLATAGLLAQQAVQRWRAAAYLRQSETARSFEAEVTALDHAAAIEPANGDTAARLGEIYRLQAFDGKPGWEPFAQAAWQWFQRAMQLNRWDTYPILHGAMTLDWLGRHAEALALFERALKMDPNNHYAALLRGWHEMQVGNWAAAKQWLERSLEIKPWYNWLTRGYLDIVNQRLKEAQRLQKPAGAP